MSKHFWNEFYHVNGVHCAVEYGRTDLPRFEAKLNAMEENLGRIEQMLQTALEETNDVQLCYFLNNTPFRALDFWNADSVAVVQPAEISDNNLFNHLKLKAYPSRAKNN